MTWTSAFGKGSGWLLQKIVNGLALSKISPNTLTFIGLLINILAAFFFGYVVDGEQLEDFELPFAIRSNDGRGIANLFAE